MELENLKVIWKQLDVESNAGEIDMQVMISQKSRGPIASMKRNLLLELALMIVMYGITVAWFFVTDNSRYREVSWFMLGIGLFYFIYFCYKYRLLSQMQQLSGNLQRNLQLQVSSLEKYVRFYLISGTVMVPLGFLFAFFVGRSRYYPNNWLLTDEKPAILWIAALCSIACTILMYFINAWYIRKLYGHHITELRRILDEVQTG